MVLGWCSLAISLQCAKPPNNLQLVIYCGWVCTTNWVSRGRALAAWLLLYYGHSPPGPRRPPLQPSYHPPRAAAVPPPTSFPTNVSSGYIVGGDAPKVMLLLQCVGESRSRRGLPEGQGGWLVPPNTTQLAGCPQLPNLDMTYLLKWYFIGALLGTRLPTLGHPRPIASLSSI